MKNVVGPLLGTLGLATIKRMVSMVVRGPPRFNFEPLNLEHGSAGARRSTAEHKIFVLSQSMAVLPGLTPDRALMVVAGIRP